MNTIEVGRISVGAVYEHHQQRIVRRDGERVCEDVSLGRWRVSGFARCGLTYRELVVAVPEVGGQAVVYSLEHFAREFRQASET